MEYNQDKKEIILNKELNELDKLVIEFLKILEKHVEYVVISGYVSILLGRSRATEDVDVFIKSISKEKFSKLYEELRKSNFWCINADETDEVFDYLKGGFSIRFARTGFGTPNFEVKFPKDKLDEETFDNFIIVILPYAKIKISSLERQIAFKKYYLSSDKDFEDALHIEELFKEQINHKKVKEFKDLIKKRKNEKR